MADQKHTIEVELIANAKKLREEIRNTVSSTKKMENMGSRMRASGIKGQKDLAKLTKQMRKGDKGTAKKALQEEKKLERQMKRTISTMRQKLREHKNNAKAIQGEIRQLSRLEQAHRKLRSQRHKAGHLTGRERLGKAMKNQKQVTGSGLAGATNFVGGAVMGLVSMIGGALIGMVTSQLSDAYATRQQYGRTYAGLTGSGGRRRDLEKVRQRGGRFGYGGIETAQQAIGVARATGQIGATTQMQALSRATMMQAGEATGFMGMLTQAGQGFGGKAGAGGKKALVDILAAGTASGLDKARMPEFFQSVGTLVTAQAGRTAGDVDAGGVSRLLAAMGMSGKSGLQGQRGGAVLSRLDQAIKAPGGGEAGQALMLQAFGFGKPGGQTSYYDALRRQEQGVFGEGNLQAMFSETKSQYGGGEAQILALRNMTGLTIDQLEAMRSVVESNLSSEEQQKELKKLAAESKTIEEQGLEAMRSGFGDTVKHIAGLENRLIGMGEALKEPVERIQAVINRLIDRFFPIIVEALERIASFLEEIFRFIQDWAGDDVMDSGKDSAKARLEQAQGELPKLMAQYRSGEIGTDEFRQKVAQLSGKIQGARMRLYRDRGVGTAMSEGVGQLGTDIARAFGADVDESAAERRDRMGRQLDEMNQQLLQARYMNRLSGGEVSGERARESIQAFLEANPRIKRRVEAMGGEQQVSSFTASGQYFDEYRSFLEANQQQYSDVLRMVRQFAEAAESAERDRAEGPASTSRRSGRSPRVDSSGGVAGR